MPGFVVRPIIPPVRVVICCLWLICAASLSAATFNIINQDENGLKNAIGTASFNGEDDVINLATNGFYDITIATNNDDGLSGLEVLADGGHTLTINGNGSTIRISPSATAFRVLIMGGYSNLTMIGVTISGGASDRGGAI